jgi:hypothetical protein
LAPFSTCSWLVAAAWQCALSKPTTKQANEREKLKHIFSYIFFIMTFRVQFTINWLCLVKSTFLKIRFNHSILAKGRTVYALISADLMNDVEA